MASIFNQYEATISHNESTNPFEASNRSRRPEPVASGYVNARVADETPIFTKSKINFKPQGPITHLEISNNRLCMIMSGRILLRINLEKPEDQEEVEITRGDDKVYKLFLDQTGSHLLIEMTSQDTVFFSKTSKKPKSLSKFKGHRIESIGWNRQHIMEASNTGTTGPLLVGTSRGSIMECCIESGEDTKFFGGSVDQYLKQLFCLGKGDSRDCSITGLEFNPFPARGGDRPTKYHILATTRTRLYQFVGRINPNSGEIPVFQNIFTPYDNGPPRFTDLPGGGGWSQLALFYKTKSRTSIPTQFAWMASPGVYFGDITVPAVEDSTSLHHLSIVANARLISYPDKESDSSNPFAPHTDPAEEVLGIALTEFHLLVLYSDRVKAICTLNEQVVYEDIYSSRFGSILGLIKDEKKGTIWTFTDRAVYKYKVFNESRNVWQMFLDDKKFDMARDYCKDNPANLDKVFTRQAEHYFEEGKYNESALYYAMTRNSFEEISLKFVRADQQEALRAFLLKKLSSLKPAEKTQTAMLVTWLVELYLNQLGKLKEENSEDYTHCEDVFKKFLAQENLKDIFLENKKTVYDLLIGHGNIEDYVFFAVLMQDYERVITHHIQNEDYSAAIEALRKQNNINLYYKFSPILMQYIPEVTVNAWISMGKNLSPKKLIPSLINCTQGALIDRPQEAIRYLEHCTGTLHCKEPAIHNYLLSLYVKQKPEAVADYIKDQGDDLEDVCYDVKYALRLCLEGGVKLQKACVEIYNVMTLYEEAVSLALKVDVDLAKSIANRPELEEEDEELRKKLWMLIARHVVQEKKDIKRAMQFLQESGDLLKIEDILPFFPDFVTIDHFKDALCESLDEYNKHIKQLKDEMNESTDSAHAIRADIQETRNHHLVVGGSDKCALCNGILLSRGFYGFPCSHSFHSDCLWKTVTPYLTPDKQVRADEMQRELNALNQSSSIQDQSGAKDSKRRRQEIVFELDELIATECAYCGEIAINSIDELFIDPQKYDDVVSSWS
uniref:vacuolar protein sorting-associated protein 18 homolog n=1 Tax=Styela clava TaxID=7725 RepID=UPI00193AA242|nr:vacuolar protein sorting-associated protein 18 homolog [Styela clava]